MTSGKNIYNNKLFQVLSSFEKKKFTGWLDVEVSNGPNWRIYFCLSRLLWADGGPHPNRSWWRHITKYCPQIDYNQEKIKELNDFKCWNYHVLAVLIRRDLISKEIATKVIESKVNEVIFDILQFERVNQIKYIEKQASADFLWESGLKFSIVLLKIHRVIQEVQSDWDNWEEKELATFSANLAPTIKAHDQLKEAVNEVVYQNFYKLFKGKLSLRDLAIMMNQDQLRLASSLNPYLKKGWLELIEIPDLTPENTPFLSTSIVSDLNNSDTTSSEVTLIVCIDDSPQVHNIMKQIINKAGYRYLGIESPIEALPTLISSPPDLIFLDIGMPTINGYELLSQIRRISKLKEKPVIMLTSNDGILDRMRSKVGGAVGFLSKPIEINQVIETIKKYTNPDN